MAFTKKDPGPVTTMFGVKKVPGGYQPTRFQVQDGKVISEAATHPAVPYEAVAYEYLTVDVVEFYAAQRFEEAKKHVPDRASPSV